MTHFTPFYERKPTGGRAAAARIAWWVALLFLLSPAPHLRAVSLDFGQELNTVVLDPGHGGKDSGAKGPGGAVEKEVTLALARVIAHRCGGRYTVHLTRTGDYAIGLAERTAVANRSGADLFISLHAGGSFRHQAGGIGVYFHLAQPQSEGAGDTGPSPTPWDRLQERHLDDSRRLARLVHSRLAERLTPTADITGALPLPVLAGADMPAVLVEIGHVSNPAEEADLQNPDHLSAAAEALCRAIDDFFVTPAP